MASPACRRRWLGPGYLDPAPLLALQIGYTDALFAEVLGVSRRQVLRWRNGHYRNGIPRASAERYAAALGRRSDDLWPRTEVAA